MSTASIGTTLFLALLLSASCGSDDKDPITATCEKVCTLDPGNACASRRTQCIEECRSFGKNAQTFGGPKCADCVCGSFVPAVSAGQCNGFTHEPELSATCRSSCLSPDGGASGL